MTSYDNNIEELLRIQSEPDCDDVLKIKIKTCIEQPQLTLDREMSLYEAMKSATAPNTSAAEELARALLPATIIQAWGYRKLGVPMERLIAAGEHALYRTAYAFDPKTKNSFYMRAYAEVENSILEELDKLGVPTVSLDELNELVNAGKADTVDEILSRLSRFERKLIMDLPGCSEEVAADDRRFREALLKTSSYFQQSRNRCLRKLRRPLGERDVEKSRLS